MVHLATVPNDDEAKGLQKDKDAKDKTLLSKALDTITLSSNPVDSYTTSVYGYVFSVRPC
jgi:hypothetical protein